MQYFQPFSNISNVFPEFEKDKKQKEIMERQLKMLEPFELLWGLFEAIFIDNSRGQSLLINIYLLNINVVK